MISGALSAGIEFDPGADAGAFADLAVQVEWHLVAVENFNAERIVSVIRYAQAGKDFSASRHRPNGDCLEAIKIRQAGCVRFICPARP